MLYTHPLPFHANHEKKIKCKNNLKTILIFCFEQNFKIFLYGIMHISKLKKFRV